MRLAALGDAPWAFGSTLAEEQPKPDTHWRERARRAAEGVETVTFVADDAGPPFRGLATGFRESPTHEHIHLYSMWVEPSARGHGIGRRLVEAVCEWGRRIGATRVVLDVTVSNDAAIRLYERCGFVPTGRTAPLPHTPSLLEQEMERAL